MIQRSTMTILRLRLIHRSGWSVLLWLLVACVLDCRCSNAPNSPTRPVDHAHWMENHLAEWGDRPLKQWTLPGSHDSAMYLTGMLQSLGRTQNLSIYDQLVEGARYFDLRPQWQPNLNGGDFYLHHDIIRGPRLSLVLDDVKRFLSEDHHELIILKFSHYAHLSSDQYARMAKQICEQLQPWLITSLPEDKRLAEVPLRQWITTRGAVLVVCDGDYPVESQTPGIWVYRDWDSGNSAKGDLRVYDQYSNTTSYSTMKTDQLAKFDHYDGQCKSTPSVPCDLFLLSWTLTPPTNVPSYAKEPNEHLAAEMAMVVIPNRFGCQVNVLYEDCVETAHATDVAVGMNSGRRN